ncbi:tyrosine-protein phosphatase [Adlercreutzia sp. ZJ304]|uniref:tyrosine-protein phosphatase n=1 Tax=Adlercreutzia sp. ZJ304 TaxID=2709791 RepID=UPI0013ED4786|nr:tyrosine-protein phosphatase [Adlercreutzia sp. ZJ304]
MTDRLAALCAPTVPHDIPGFRNFGHIKLRGVANARDLGGMPAADDRRIARRRLVRSSALHDATLEDIKQLLHMHEVDCVVDFRTNSEVEKDPDPKPLMSGVKYVHLPVFTQEAVGITGSGPARDFRTLVAYIDKPYEMIEELYPRSVLGAAGIRAYSEFLHDLLDAPKGATLWHCTQGKDRTGMATVLVEYALGVPMKYILSDYLATNLFVRGWAEVLRSLLADKTVARGLDNDVNAYAFANKCYFEAMMTAVANSYGSLDNYFVRALDFGPDKQAYLRDLYLV